MYADKEAEEIAAKRRLKSGTLEKLGTWQHDDRVGMSGLNLLTEVSPRKLSQCSTQNSSGTPLSKTVSPLSSTREAQAADFASPFVDRKTAGSESKEIQIESQPEDAPAETRWQENAKELLQPKQEGERPQEYLLSKLDPSWWSFISPKVFSPEQTKLSQTSQQPKKLSVIIAPPVASRNKGNGSVKDSMGEAHKFLLGEEAMEKIPPPSSRSALQHASHKPPHAAKVRPIADPKGSSATQNGRRDVPVVAEEVDSAESIKAPAAVRSEQEEGGPAEKPTGEPRQPAEPSSDGKAAAGKGANLAPKGWGSLCQELSEVQNGWTSLPQTHATAPKPAAQSAGIPHGDHKGWTVEASCRATKNLGGGAASFEEDGAFPDHFTARPTNQPTPSQQPVFSGRRSIWPRPVQQPSKTNYQGAGRVPAAACDCCDCSCESEGDAEAHLASVWHSIRFSQDARPWGQCLGRLAVNPSFRVAFPILDCACRMWFSTAASYEEHMRGKEHYRRAFLFCPVPHINLITANRTAVAVVKNLLRLRNGDEIVTIRDAVTRRQAHQLLGSKATVATVV